MSDFCYPQGLRTCGDCGKLCYPTRRDAKRQASRHGTRRRAYRCGGAWHLASYQPAGKVAFYRERATVPGHYPGGASVDEGYREEIWRDATS